jgi:hypothetical protein
LPVWLDGVGAFCLSRDLYVRVVHMRWPPLVPTLTGLACLPEHSCVT